MNINVCLRNHILYSIYLFSLHLLAAVNCPNKSNKTCSQQCFCAGQGKNRGVLLSNSIEFYLIYIIMFTPYTYIYIYIYIYIYKKPPLCIVEHNTVQQYH